MSPDCLTLTVRLRATAADGLQSVFRVERAPHNSQQRLLDYANRAAQHGAVDGATRCLPQLLDIRYFPTAEACIHSLKTTGCAVWALVRIRLPPSVASRATQTSALALWSSAEPFGGQGGAVPWEQTKRPKSGSPALWCCVRLSDADVGCAIAMGTIDGRR